MMTRQSPTQAEFYRRFLMGRGAFDPRAFGVDMEREAFQDAMVEEFHKVFRDSRTIDELLLHPVDAARFCSDLRMRTQWWDVPDDIILRSIMTRRKNPGGSPAPLQCPHGREREQAGHIEPQPHNHEK